MSDTQFVSPLNKEVIEKDYASEFDEIGEDLGDPVDQVEPAPKPTPRVESRNEAPQVEVSEPSGVMDIDGDDLEFQFDEGGLNYDELEGDGEGGDGFGVSEEASELGSEWITDFIKTLSENELPRILHNQSKIPESKIKIAEIEGLLNEGSIDQVKEVNKNNEKAFKSTVKDQMKMIEEPLKQVLKARNVNVSPETALAGAVVLAGVVIFFQFREVKQQNAELIQKIFKDNKR